VNSISKKIDFSDSVLLVENKTKDSQMLINNFIKKIDSFKEPYKVKGE
jgi:hypothetical protein